MATARKSAANRPKAKSAGMTRSAHARAANAKAPAARAAKPSATRAGSSRPVAAAARARVAARKPVAAKAKPRVIGRPAVAGKTPPASARVIGRPAVPGKPGAKPAVGKPAVAAKAGAARVIGKPAVPGKVIRDAKGRIVAQPAPIKKPGGKPVIRVVSHGPVASARPIGALPPEAVARAMKGHGPLAPIPPRKPVRPTRDAKPSTGVEGVSEKDFKDFETRLLTERQKIMKDMGYLENTVLKVNQRDSAGDLSGYSFHMADVGTDAYEREKAFLFASSEGRLLMDVDDALRKLYRGEYGRCEICEQPIARARLEAMPAARLCLSCKEKQEREHRGAS
jgi:DnaK suppressor protein